MLTGLKPAQTKMTQTEMETPMYSIADLLKGVGAVSAVALAICLIANSAHAEPKKKPAETPIRVVPKYLPIHKHYVVHPHVPKVAAPAGNLGKDTKVNVIR